MKVLIAEDDPTSRHALGTILSNWGYEVVPVPDGVSALEQLRQPDGPKLVVLDWSMPGLDGVEVCRRVREHREQADTPYIYILMLTGRGDREALLAGLEAGADEYLIKPVDFDELRARLQAGVRILQVQDEYLSRQAALREQAAHDPLTGLWNRGGVFDLLEREIARARRTNTPLALLLADLDHFKSVNDKHGHLTGDAVLRETAARIQSAVRRYDSAGRYGGEEFLVVLPNCDVPQGVGLAERLRERVSASPVRAGRIEVCVTLSVGVAVSPPDNPLDAYTLLDAADRALYRAKDAGRNRVELGSAETCSHGTGG